MIRNKLNMIKNWHFYFIVLVAMVYSYKSKAQIYQPVQWNFEIIKVKKDEAIIKMTATIEEGWHLYSQHIEPGGPLPTYFEFKPSQNYELIGKVIEKTPSVTRFESVFAMEVNWFETVAVFEQRIKLKSPNTSIKGTVEYMTCKDDMCLPPTEEEFEVKINYN